MNVEQPQPTNEAAGGASDVERVVGPDEFPPVPDQLLWMFDAIDRKEATKMMHDYAKTCVTNRLAKPLRDAWERAQKAEDKAIWMEDDIVERDCRIAVLEDALRAIADSSVSSFVARGGKSDAVLVWCRACARIALADDENS